MSNSEVTKEKLIAGKFGSREELEKAYRALESAFTKKSQEVSRIQQELMHYKDKGADSQGEEASPVHEGILINKVLEEDIDAVENIDGVEAAECAVEFGKLSDMSDTDEVAMEAVKTEGSPDGGEEPKDNNIERLDGEENTDKNNGSYSSDDHIGLVREGTSALLSVGDSGAEKDSVELGAIDEFAKKEQNSEETATPHETMLGGVELTKVSESDKQGNESATSEETLPADYGQDIDRFFTDNTSAILYAEKIGEMVKGVPDYGSLVKAYNEVLVSEVEKLKKPSAEVLLDMVSNNTDVIEEVLGRYFEGIKRDNPPVTIKGGYGVVAVTPPKRPKSLSDAAGIAKSLLKK